MSPRRSLVALATVAGALTACAGSSAGTGSAPPSSTTSAAAVPTTSSPAIIGGAPSRFAEPMSQAAAQRVIPRLRKQPGVFRVVYSPKVGRLFVYLFARVTTRQRDHVVQLVGQAAG